MAHARCPGTISTICSTSRIGGRCGNCARRSPRSADIGAIISPATRKNRRPVRARWAILDLVHDRADCRNVRQDFVAAPESDRRLRAVRGSHADVCRAARRRLRAARRPLLRFTSHRPRRSSRMSATGRDSFRCSWPASVWAAAFCRWMAAPLPGRCSIWPTCRAPISSWSPRRPRRSGTWRRRRCPCGLWAIVRRRTRDPVLASASRNRRAHSESHVRLHRPAEAGRDPRGKRPRRRSARHRRDGDRGQRRERRHRPDGSFLRHGQSAAAAAVEGIACRPARSLHPRPVGQRRQAVRRHDVPRRAVHLRLSAPRRRRRLAAPRHPPGGDGRCADRFSDSRVLQRPFQREDSFAIRHDRNRQHHIRRL